MTRYARIVLAPTALLLLALSLGGCKPAASSSQDAQTVKELRKAKTGD